MNFVSKSLSAVAIALTAVSGSFAHADITTPQAQQFMVELQRETTSIDQNDGHTIRHKMTIPEQLEKTTGVFSVEFSSPTRIRVYATKAESKFIEFKSPDSARIFHNLLVNSQRSYTVAFYEDDWNVHLERSDYDSFYFNANAGAIYLIDNEKQVLLKLGDVIGPARNPSKQNPFDQLMIKTFGRAYLNGI